MSETAGYFIDWNGQARSCDDPGGGYRCDVDRPARYVAVLTPNGTLAHEATLYRPGGGRTRGSEPAELRRPAGARIWLAHAELNAA
jgi:hypothetical protein